MNNRVNEERLAYKMADEKFKELLEKLEKFNSLFDSFDFDTIDRELRGEKFEDVIIARSRVVEAASVACELYGKYLLLTIGKTWGDLKRLGHNLSNLYNALDDGQRADLEREIFYMYNVIGGDLSKLEVLISSYQTNIELCKQSAFFAKNKTNNGIPISQIEDFIPKTEEQQLSGVFSHMMRLIIGDYQENVSEINSSDDIKQINSLLKNLNEDDKIRLIKGLYNSNNSSPILINHNTGIPNIEDLFVGGGQPLGVKARYTQDLLRDLKQEEILFLIAMAYGLSKCSQKVYEASNQPPTNGK